MSTGQTYLVRENTSNPEDPSVDDVLDLVSERAADPRPDEHPDSHFDEYVRDAVSRFGESAVAHCVRLELEHGYTHRAAGAEVFGEQEYVWGINVGVAATTYLREIRGDHTLDQ